MCLNIRQFDDGREIELLHFVYSQPNIDDIRGSPEDVIAAIDKYARTKKYLMNVGVDKGKYVTELIAQLKPKVMVELGGYVAYSAVLFGDAQRKAGGQKFICLEKSPEFAAVILALVDLAGLRDFVQVIVGSSDKSLLRLHKEGVLDQIDLLFLDHYKPLYLKDLKLCEQLKMVRPGTTLAADNVIKPGNPPYLEYVRSTVEQKRSKVGKEDIPDNFDDVYAIEHNQRTSQEGLEIELQGNPNLVYESRLINSFEPTGVPVSVNYHRICYAS